MTNIDRRKLLSSLTAATVCAPVVSTINPADATARRDSIHKSGHSCAGWILARELRRQRPDHAVDFWARPYCEIPYTQYLPREITRGAMWYDIFKRSRQRTLEEINSSFKHYCFAEADTPFRFAAHLDGCEALASTLRSLIEDEVSNPATRTAFISLDSLGPLREPSWADVLPAFRSSYDRVICHFHLPQRGLRQWRKFLNGHFHSASGRGYFQEFFTDAAAQCDAVILTSSALVESDLRCSPCASTEELTGKLMRDLGYALLTPAVRERIVGVGEGGTVRKPRFFALSSLTLETMDDYYLNCDLMILRQADLVRGSFGDAIPDERFLLVATAAEDLHSDLVEEIRRTAGGSFFTTITPAVEVEKRGYPILNLLQMITLWPFEFDEHKLRLAEQTVPLHHFRSTVRAWYDAANFGGYIMPNFIQCVGYALGKVHTGMLCYLFERYNEGEREAVGNLFAALGCSPLPNRLKYKREWKGIDLMVSDAESDAPFCMVELKVDDHEHSARGTKKIKQRFTQASGRRTEKNIPGIRPSSQQPRAKGWFAHNPIVRCWP